MDLGRNKSLEVMQFCHENNNIFCRLPSHTSHKLQPCDVGVFGPLKTAYRERVEELYRGGANTVSKQHFTFLYSQARCAAFTSRNIKSAWTKAGLYPWNPDRVLQDIQKPPSQEPQSKYIIDTAPDNKPLQTPVTAEGLTSLRKIIK
jgi:DDE superfamily endonuclease